MGAELRMGPGRTVVPADRRFEYAVVPIDEPVKVGDAIVEPDWLGLVPPGAETIPVEVGDRGGRAMVLGGEPLGERIQMWWNFVARTKDEITDAWRAWQRHDTDRFGPVPSRLPRIDAPRPPWVKEDA